MNRQTVWWKGREDFSFQKSWTKNSWREREKERGKKEEKTLRETKSKEERKI